jgi:hypothetical protein
VRTQRQADRKGQQQVFRVMFTVCGNSVRALVRNRMDSLARKFHDTQYAVHDEIYRLAGELIKLDEPSKFVVS